MSALLLRLDRMDLGLARWLSRHSVAILRVGLGLVFLWFGVLKFFPGASPAQDLAVRTTDVLTLGLVPTGASIALLATLECAIGLLQDTIVKAFGSFAYAQIFRNQASDELLSLAELDVHMYDSANDSAGVSS